MQKVSYLGHIDLVKTYEAAEVVLQSHAPKMMHI